MNKWISEHWYLIKINLWAVLINVIALLIWDWRIHSVSCSSYIARGVFSFVVFVSAYIIQVAVHIHRQYKEEQHATKD